MQIGQRIFVLADVIRLNVFFENALGRVVQLVCITPNGMPPSYIRDGLKALKCRIINQIFFIITMCNDVTGVANCPTFQIRCVETKELRFADLLRVAE